MLTVFEEGAQRKAAVAEARSWVGTPYVLGGRIKQVGCDCVTFIAEGAIACGMLSREEVETMPIYSHDWWAHAKDDLYLLRLLRHAAKVAEAKTYRTLMPEPANLILTKVNGSRVLNHGAVITQWPFAVHAIVPKVEEIDVTRHPMWAHEEITILDGWALRRTA